MGERRKGAGRTHYHPPLPPSRPSSVFLCITYTYIYRIVLHYVPRTTHSLDSSIQTTLRLYSVQVPTIHMSDSCAPVPFFTHSIFSIRIHPQIVHLFSVHVLNLHANTHTLSLPPSPPLFSSLFRHRGPISPPCIPCHRKNVSRIESYISPCSSPGCLVFEKMELKGKGGGKMVEIGGGGKREGEREDKRTHK